MTDQKAAPQVSEPMEELVSNACEEAADYATSPAINPPSSYPARDALLRAIETLEQKAAFYDEMDKALDEAMDPSDSTDL